MACVALPDSAYCVESVVYIDSQNSRFPLDGMIWDNTSYGPAPTPPLKRGSLESCSQYCAPSTSRLFLVGGDKYQRRGAAGAFLIAFNITGEAYRVEAADIRPESTSNAHGQDAPEASCEVCPPNVVGGGYLILLENFSSSSLSPGQIRSMNLTPTTYGRLRVPCF